MKSLIKLIIAGVVISVLCSAGHADRIYTWKDEKGITHITKDPPPHGAELIDATEYEESATPPEDEDKPVSTVGEGSQPQETEVQESGKSQGVTGEVDADLQSGTEENTCWFKANSSYDVYFIVREKIADQGDREYVMWKGWVKSYDKKRYVSKSGQIRYDYKTSIDDGIVGDNNAPCKNGNVIQVP